MLTPEERAAHIRIIAEFPAHLREMVAGLTPEQINTETIPAEWTVRQIVHHLADSHMNSLIRLKLMLTTENPPLIGYPQATWAELPDVYANDIETSLKILEGLHARWVSLFESLEEEDWSRIGTHTEIGAVNVEYMLTAYSNHCNIHTEQIQRVLAAYTP